MIDKLMSDVAKWHGISVKELNRRLTQNGEPLVHMYYVQKYGDDFI
tara:strand:- start:8901 stop:9038 length:138 start_codon:yes stop_codon:yes gene_type:complete